MKRKLYRAPMLLAFCGARGAGKTTVAQAIVDRYQDFVRMSFADPIREEAAATLQHARMLDPLVDQYLKSHPPFAHGFKDQPIPGLGITPRDLLIQTGSARREEDPLYWVNAMKQRILNEPRHVVIDDLRYDSEIIFLVECNGFVVELDLEGVQTDYTGTMLSWGTHLVLNAHTAGPESMSATAISELIRADKVRRI
jgi:hypothetical protein